MSDVDFTTKENSELLVDDGHAQLSFRDMTEHLGPGVFSIIARDGGGYTSVYLTKECWGKMKQKVDTLVAEMKCTPS